MLVATLALAMAAFTTGTASYVSFVEQPARLALDDEAMLAEWKRATLRGYVLHAFGINLAVAFGLLAWWRTGLSIFALGTALMGSSGCGWWWRCCQSASV